MNKQARTAGALRLAAVLGFALTWGNTPAVGVPLDRNHCQALSRDYATLLEEGIEEEIAKGPDWAMVNLSSEGIERIRRFLSVEDQIRFRCPGFELPGAASRQNDAQPQRAGVPMPNRRPDAPEKSGKAAALQPVPAKGQ